VAKDGPVKTTRLLNQKKENIFYILKNINTCVKKIKNINTQIIN
jgi:hypothetical protein